MISYVHEKSMNNNFEHHLPNNSASKKDSKPSKQFCNEKEISDVILNLNNLNTETSSNMASVAHFITIVVLIIISLIILIWSHQNAKKSKLEDGF